MTRRVLTGVYTVAFVTLMAFFAVGNIILKLKRASLLRGELVRCARACMGVRAGVHA